MDHLTVSGDVTFGRGVSLKVNSFSSQVPFDRNTEHNLIQSKFFFHFTSQGTVIIIANHGDRIDIPAGAVLENKIVSGNLRILDH